MAWGKLVGISVAMIMVGSIAGAEPVETNAFVPVAVGDAATDGDSVVVASGDHLWNISAAHLELRLSRPPEPDEVAPYWRSVIEINRNHLLSGDPDLIYPGEVISFPETG